MRENFEDYQVEQFEQAAYQGAMLEAGKEWERQREEFDLHEDALRARAEKAEAMVERLIEAGGPIADSLSVYQDRKTGLYFGEWDNLVAEWNQSKKAEVPD